MLTCSFGEDLSYKEMDFEDNGVITRKKVPYVLREVFHKCVMRMVSTQIVLFPKSGHWYLTAHDRENKRNCERIRDLCLEVVQKRRQQIANGLNTSDSGDLLTILLTDDLFKNDERLIIDECLTFFFAGS